jgi:heme A synthase
MLTCCCFCNRRVFRFLGVAFAVPATYFAARGHINGPLGRRLGLLFLMGGAQGLVGWWMVRSGLEVRALLLLLLLLFIMLPIKP